MEYRHTQAGPWHWAVTAVAAVLLAVPVAMSADGAESAGFMAAILVPSGLFAAVIALAFRHMTVEDGGDRLVVRYGPLPLFRASFPYAEITAVEPGRTSFIDGWGVHWVAGRGWTYNIWGFDCVVLSRGDRTTRIGTDDRAGLLEFLRSRVSQAA